MFGVSQKGFSLQNSNHNAVLQLHPDDNVAIALVTILRDQGKNEAALKYLEPLLQRNPQNTQLLSLQRQLQRS